MKITINGFVLWKKEDYEGEGHFYFKDWEYPEGGYGTVQPQTIEFDVPANFNPIPGQLNILKEQEQALRAKFADDMTTIEERRSKLLAIAHEVS